MPGGTSITPTPLSFSRPERSSPESTLLSDRDDMSETTSERIVLLLSSAMSGRGLTYFFSALSAAISASVADGGDPVSSASRSFSRRSFSFASSEIAFTSA